MSIDPTYDVVPPGFAPGTAQAGMPNLVAHDLPCRKCSYNLRGLPLDGRCPECGAAVGLSSYGDLLRFSSPDWLLTLKRGVVFILFGIFVLVLAIILEIAISGARGAAGTASQSLWSALVSLAASALMVAGAWLLTEPDPSGLGEQQYGTSRKLIRITTAIGALNSLLTFGTTVAPPQPPGVNMVLGILGFGFGVAGLVGTFAQLQYLKKLAFRIPDTTLAKRAQFLMYAIAISYGVILVISFVIVLLVGAAGVGMGSLAALGCFVAIAGISLLVFGIMYLFMLDGFRRRFAGGCSRGPGDLGPRDRTGVHALPASLTLALGGRGR